LISEVAALKVSGIDRDRMLLRIEQCKGQRRIVCRRPYATGFL